MMILKRFTVDLENPGSTPIIPAVQNSSCDPALEIELRKNRRPYRIPKDIRAVVRYKKLDGKGGEYDTMGDGSPAWETALDRLTVKLAHRMFAMPGSVEVAVTLYQSDSVIGYIPVILYVEGSGTGALPDSGEHMSGSSGGGWPAPATAKKGQFLRVAAVDGSGKVTALDAAEASSYPDWNQNDDTQADYIKNRPFYSYTCETDTVSWNRYCESVAIFEGTEEEMRFVRLPAEVTPETLLGGITLRLTMSDGTVQELHDFEGDYAGSTVCEPMDDYLTQFFFFDGIMGFYVSTDGYTLTDEDISLTFPKAGLWLMSYFDYYFPGCSCAFVFRSGPVSAEAVVPISGKFIPSLPYIHEGEREYFASTEDLVGRKVSGGGELFNNASSASGPNSHAEGHSTQATGEYAHAEGCGTKATGNGSHAEGYSSEASLYAHAEGYNTKAYGTYSHAEGYNAKANGLSGHAEGYGSSAEGHYSHAEGYYSHAKGDQAHAEGIYSHAYSPNQHVQGKYNLEDSQAKYAHIVGNGSGAEARSNAHTIDWEGNGWFAGTIKVGGTGQDDEAAAEIPTKAEVQEMIDVAVEAAGGSGTGAETETVLSDNLLDKSLLTQGQVFYYGSSGYQLVASTYSCYGFIPLRGAGTYRTKFQASVHSSTGTRIALVNDDNSFVANATGTAGEATVDGNWVDFEFVVTESHIAAGATKVAFDVYSLYLDSTMIVKDREYPSEYIPYGYIEVATDSGKKQDNVLCGKTAVFLGDSICAGTTVDADSGYYGYGWGGIIGESNHMTWKNYGKNGGVITPREAVSESYWISKYADTAAAEYPAADYVIFEGGCNDADQMKDSGLGEISSDYSTFDTTTFTGALECLILKILTTWPMAKVGYIIPQKMYTGYSDYTAANHIHRKYFERAIAICQKWGIPYVDIWNSNPLNPKLATHGIFYVEENGQHLTLAGYQRITPQIEAFMRSL